jgi:hypothetical protein
MDAVVVAAWGIGELYGGNFCTGQNAEIQVNTFS